MKTNKKLMNGPSILRILALALIFLAATGIYAQDFTKTYQEQYDVDKGASLVIKNKFGNVNCQAWDESSVSINVTVKVDASSQEKANKVFDKITVSLSGTRSRVEGSTTVGSISNADFSINYDIRMPRWINLDLDNQFGDIYLDENDGQAKINLEYGAMEANALNGSNTDITIKFSDGETGYIKSGTIHVEYSEWKTKGAESLKLVSRFSEVNVDKLASLNLDSQYDEVTVENAVNAIVVSRFSELDFGRITGDFDFDIEYGELDVDFIASTFKTGKIRNSFAGVDLGIDPAASMNIDAEIEFGDLSYPKGKSSLNHTTEGYTTQIYKGRIGSSTSPASQLTIRSKNADTNIEFEE